MESVREKGRRKIDTVNIDDSSFTIKSSKEKGM